MRKTIVCGEALMDVFALADTPTGVSLEARVGGSPFNVAVGLARLGQPVAFLGAVSRGFLGERLIRALRDEGVDTSTTRRVDAPTTLGLVGLDANGVASYPFYGEGGADRQLAAEALNGVPSTASSIHVGSFATMVEPIASTLHALIDREHDRALISYDPNVRLNVDADIGRWRAAFDWMLRRVHVLKISEEDLALLCPGLSAEGFSAKALSSGVRLVVVTRGASGAIAATASGHATVDAIPVAVIDTVGAGDAFQAALLTWLAENGSLSAMGIASMTEIRLQGAVRFACTAASLTCSRRGADPPARGELAAALAAQTSDAGRVQ